MPYFAAIIISLVALSIWHIVYKMGKFENFKWDYDNVATPLTLLLGEFSFSYNYCFVKHQPAYDAFLMPIQYKHVKPEASSENIVHDAFLDFDKMDNSSLFKSTDTKLENGIFIT